MESRRKPGALHAWFHATFAPLECHGDCRSVTIASMNRMRQICRVTLCGAAVVAIATIARSDDPLAPWRTEVTEQDEEPAANEHTIHAYYVTCPESPDGRKVLFYASPTRNG